MALALVCAGCYLFRLQLLPCAAYCLDVGSIPQQVDFVMALPGDLERRPFVAAAMVNLGLADNVLIPKNAASPEEIDGVAAPSCEVARRVYQARGIATDRIVILEGESQTTFDDLVLMARHLDRHPSTTAGVVTNAFHTRRTQWTLWAQFPEHAGRITVISAPNPEFDADTWWRSEVGFLVIISEHLKLLFYWVRYGTGTYWILGLVIIVVGVATRRYIVARRGIAPSGDRI